MPRSATAVFTRASSSRAILRRGRALADRLGYDYAPDVGDRTAPIIVNVTPIGMAGGPEESDAAFDEATIAKAHVVFDVVALPSETPLIKAARAAGVKVITGAEVIALQAAEQFERYTGVRPDPRADRRGLGDLAA